MGFNVIVTEDYNGMSEAAARILLPVLRATTVDKQRQFNLGTATGNSPVGLYSRIVDRQEEFDARLVNTWALDEYIGLPGETSSERVLHPESYGYFMIQNLFGRMNPSFAKTRLPPGTEIDQRELEASLKEAKEYISMDGTDKGMAVVISPECDHPYLKKVKALLEAYTSSIESAGGIDYWIVGVGGRGHIAFHESGIPLDHKILLVKLDDNTVENAVADGHFSSKEEAPWYAISMGAGGVVEYAKNIILVANGERKTEPIVVSLLGPETADVPISILQRYIGDKNRHVTYVLDEIAAAGILGKEERLLGKGITVSDIRV